MFVTQPFRPPGPSLSWPVIPAQAESAMSQQQLAIHVEKGSKSSTCRSCNTAIEPGLLRIKVSYPHVIVEYTTRSGAPFYFLHPECFKSSPVDYIKTGSDAWKHWSPVQRFELKSEAQIIGLKDFPSARQYLSRCTINGRPVDSTRGVVAQDKRSKRSGDLDTPTVAAQQPTPPISQPPSMLIEAHMDDRARIKQLQPRVQLKTTEISYQDFLDDCAGDEIEAAKRYKTQLEDATRQASNHDTAAVPSDPDHSSRASHMVTSGKTVSLAAVSTITKKRKATNESVSERDSDSETDASSLSLPDSKNDDSALTVGSGKMKWSKPGVTSQLVGVSSSILRNWANAGVVKTIISEGGHRLFNVDSVKRHMEENATKAAEQATKRMKQASQPTRILVFVRVPNSKRTTLALEHQQLLIDNVKTQIMKNYPKQPNTELRASDVITAVTHSTAERTRCTTAVAGDSAGLLQLFRSMLQSRRSRVVLKDTKDVSDVPSTYALFECMCCSMNITIEIVPELYTLQ